MGGYLPRRSSIRGWDRNATHLHTPRTHAHTHIYTHVNKHTCIQTRIHTHSHTQLTHIHQHNTHTDTSQTLTYAHCTFFFFWIYVQKIYTKFNKQTHTRGVRGQVCCADGKVLLWDYPLAKHRHVGCSSRQRRGELDSSVPALCTHTERELERG